MISTLASLVRHIEKQPHRAVDLFNRYHGNDWNQHIRYKFEKPTKISLSNTTPIFLIGLMEKQKYRFESPATIRILEEEYLYRYPSSKSYKTYQDFDKLSYSSYEVSQSNYIIGKDYTSLLILEHYY